MSNIERKKHFDVIKGHLLILQNESPRPFKTTEEALVKLVDILGEVARSMGLTSYHVFEWVLIARLPWPDLAPPAQPLFDTIDLGRSKVDAERDPS